jgi:methylenetetrahydrofolate reductase (NADPH)
LGRSTAGAAIEGFAGLFCFAIFVYDHKSMKIKDLFTLGRPVRSFEVFPPKRDGDVESLYRCFDELKPLKPDYISVTYGAGGSNAGLHYEINAQLLKMGITPLAHFTCVGHSKSQIRVQLDRLRDAGVENILALRGDPPKGADKFTRPEDGFGYASELVEFIREHYDFCIGVAGYPETHPEAENPEADLRMMLKKVGAGADFITTQLFFDNADYAAYVAKLRALGVALPVTPGVMPVLTPKFFARDWGVKFPAGFRESIESASGPEEAEARGIAFAVAQCRGLLTLGAPGLHLYAMNKAQSSLKIYGALNAEP